jgi:hypothetical protein
VNKSITSANITQSLITSSNVNQNQETKNSDVYLGSIDDKEKQEQETSQEPENEMNPLIDETERFITERPLFKHFECTEVDIDFNNISDTIDVNEPSFEVPEQSLSMIKQSQSQSQVQCQGVPKAQTKTQPITLKKHKDVLYEMYKIAKHKAAEMKRAAMRAYLEAKEIKAKYLLDDLDDLHSDTSDDDSKN